MDAPPEIPVTEPVARVLVDSGLPHLDRPFDYAVPAALAETARPGVRVKVRFAGRDVGGFVVERCARADHEGTLTPIRAVVSPEPVLTPAVLALAREVAAAYAGTVGDVLRLAIPPRHARAEKALPDAVVVDTVVADAVIADTVVAVAADPGPVPVRPAETTAWEPYAAGPAFLRHLREGGAPVAVWSALPSATRPESDWPLALAQACAATAAGGRGAIVVVPDHRDVARVSEALRQVLGPAGHVELRADQGPQARYTAWLKALRGHVRVVVGTRSAAFAPVRDLGLIAVWDDGDDLHEEPRAPYPHVRDLALRRGRIEGAAVLVGGFGRTVAAQAVLASGVGRPVAAAPSVVRAAVPRIVVAGEDREQERDPAAARARLPALALRTAREALARGPVLVQVPRRGYIPGLACQTCRTRARCPACRGPLALGDSGPTPVCRWCAAPAPGWTCPECGDRRLRSLVVGARRTAEELGRAFPGVGVITSGAGEVRDRVVPGPALVIATPGAEPVAEGGYAAALLLDAWALLDRTALDASPEALRRWVAAAALVRPAGEGGQVVVCGVSPEVSFPAVEALVRWDPAWLAERELGERVALRLPPSVVLSAATGPRAVLEELAGDRRLPPSVERFGPVAQPGRPEWRLVLKAGGDDVPALARILAQERAARSARKEVVPLGIRMFLTGLD